MLTLDRGFLQGRTRRQSLQKPDTPSTRLLPSLMPVRTPVHAWLVQCPTDRVSNIYRSAGTVMVPMSRRRRIGRPSLGAMMYSRFVVARVSGHGDRNSHGCDRADCELPHRSLLVRIFSNAVSCAMFREKGKVPVCFLPARIVLCLRSGRAVGANPPCHPQYHKKLLARGAAGESWY